MQEIQDILRALKPRPVPARLAAQLRVMASHERQRQLARRTWRDALGWWYTRIHLHMDNLMRPLALPFAGGLLSALVLFSMLVPTLNFRHNFRDDVPIFADLYTNPTLLEPSPFCSGDDDFMVELTIDEKGQVADYRMSEGKMTKELANDLLFSRFTPATFLGQPTFGKIYFRRSRMVVKG